MAHALMALPSRSQYEFRMCHRIALSTDVLSLSKVVPPSPQSVSKQGKLQMGTPLHWWWEVSTPYNYVKVIKHLYTCACLVVGGECT